jgi:zinc D-Ala-D-Ala carboxypeptidase
MTPHFTLDELTFSMTAKNRGIPNTPAGVELENLRRTAHALERVRAAVGRPVRVSSGYRSPALNTAIGGSKTSAHMRGLAADVSVVGMSSRELAIAAAKALENEFDQIIDEFGRWVHIGLSETAPRGHLLRAEKQHGRTVYKPLMLEDAA